MEGSSLDAASLQDAICRSIPPCGASGAVGGSPSLAGTVGVLAITFKPMAAAFAAGSDSTRCAPTRKFRLVGSLGLPQGVCLALDPFAAAATVAVAAAASGMDAASATAGGATQTVALLSLPACPGASTDVLAAASCIARAAASLLGMLPCGAARCIFEAAGGSKSPLPRRPLRECPACTRKLCTLSSGCPGGMGAAAARIVGRLRVLRACLLEVLLHLAPDAYRPAEIPRPGGAGSSASSSPPGIAAWEMLPAEAACHALRERVWLRERALELTALGLASPCASDDVDLWDEVADAAPAPRGELHPCTEAAIAASVAVAASRAVAAGAVQALSTKTGASAAACARDTAPGHTSVHEPAPAAAGIAATTAAPLRAATDLSADYMATAAYHVARDRRIAAKAREKQMGWGAAPPWDR